MPRVVIAEGDPQLRFIVVGRSIQLADAGLVVGLSEQDVESTVSKWPVEEEQFGPQSIDCGRVK